MNISVRPDDGHLVAQRNRHESQLGRRTSRFEGTDLETNMTLLPLKVLYRRIAIRDRRISSDTAFGV